MEKIKLRIAKRYLTPDFIKEQQKIGSLLFMNPNQPVRIPRDYVDLSIEEIPLSPYIANLPR